MTLFQSRLWRLLQLFLFLVLVYTLSRGVYLIWNLSFFSQQSFSHLLKAFWVGARFDLSALAYLNLPLLLITLIPWPAGWEKTWVWTIRAGALILNIPFLTINLIDVEFVNFVGRRMTVDVLFLLGEAQGKFGGFFWSFLPLFLMATAVHLVAAFGLWKIPTTPPGIVARPGRASLSWIFGFSVFMGVVLAARGGIQNKPINFVDANLFPAPVLNNLVLNTTFNILKSLGQEPLERVRYFENREDYLPLLNGASPATSLLEKRRPSPPQNVVILILESFGREYMGAINGVKGYTPFLDELAERSLFFENGYANGRRSIEGVAAVMSGIPALMNEPFISSSFTANYFLGLGTLLSEKGYHTSFFHGGNNGTMHFDAFMQSAGIEHYFGAREYANPKDHDGVWGIYDGPMLRFFAEKLKTIPQPFFTAFFTLSSHNPYLIPPEEASRFADGPLPILKAIAYTDQMVREFFLAASREPWYPNTLFVVLADHTFRAYLPQHDNEVERYRIPILFYHPGYQWPKEIDRRQIVQQIDILPSVLDYLNIPVKERNWLARSVFEPGPRAAVFFLDGAYLMVTDEYILRWPRGGDIEIYAAADPFFKEPLGENLATEKREELVRRLRAHIQYFSDGMWDNRLYFPAR